MKTRSTRKSLTGIVVNNNMDKTVMVKVERLIRHPAYKKFVLKKAKFMAHDEEKKCKPGDWVLITETRPLSKRKRFQVSKILEKERMQ